MTTPGLLELDGLTLAGVRAGALRGRPVTVLGLARSGIALARFLADAGARVTVYDGRPAEELADAIDALGDRPVAPRARTRRRRGRDVGRTRRSSRRRRRSRPTSRRPSRGCARRSVELVDARAAGDPAAPALVSEADLFLRLCPVPTIGVTGTKGKTTTSSLTAALLAADPAHPVVLGGNIGLPLIERLPELTPGPPGRRRALRAPAADAVARHDRRRLHERHRRPPRPARVARGVPRGSSGGWPSWSTRPARSS